LHRVRGETSADEEKKMSYLIAAAFLLSGATPQTAPPAAPDAAGDKRICREFAQTGSRLARKRVCMTAAEWTEHERITQDVLDRDARGGRRAGK